MAKTKEELLKQLEQEQLLPLYTATDLDILPVVEEVLTSNGLNFIEVTYRSDLASAAIKQLSQSGKLIVGAGTVRDLATAKDAIENGATFIVTPGFSPEVVDYCNENDVLVVPGTVTPSEIIQAMDKGISTVKFFPADVYGGLKAIKALSGPFFDIKFVPTGGVNLDNCKEFLSNDAIAAVGGSFIISEKLVQEDNGVSADKNIKEILEKIK